MSSSLKLMDGGHNRFDLTYSMCSGAHGDTGATDGAVHLHTTPPRSSLPPRHLSEQFPQLKATHCPLCPFEGWAIRFQWSSVASILNFIPSPTCDQLQCKRRFSNFVYLFDRWLWVAESQNKSILVFCPIYSL